MDLRLTRMCRTREVPPTIYTVNASQLKPALNNSCAWYLPQKLHPSQTDGRGSFAHAPPHFGGGGGRRPRRSLIVAGGARVLTTLLYRYVGRGAHARPFSREWAVTSRRTCAAARASPGRHLPTPQPPFSRSRSTKVDRLPIFTPQSAVAMATVETARKVFYVRGALIDCVVILLYRATVSCGRVILPSSRIVIGSIVFDHAPGFGSIITFFFSYFLFVFLIFFFR